MPGFVGNSACTDTMHLNGFRSMYSLGIAMARVRWNVQSKGTPFTAGDIGRRFAYWIKCVANKDIGITMKWPLSKPGSKIPTSAEFVDAVQNGPGSAQMHRLKGF